MMNKDNMESKVSEKTLLRKLVRERIAALDTASRAELSQKACERLMSMSEFVSAKIVMSYSPLKGECSPVMLNMRARELKKRVAYPKCVEGNNIEAYYVDSDDGFIVGSYGILEPDSERCERARKEDIELIIVPGMAFDAECRRMGRGAGYYDRFLSNFRGIKAALAFDCQLFPSIPADEYDIPMDFVVSNNGIIVKK